MHDEQQQTAAQAQHPHRIDRKAGSASLRTALSRVASLAAVLGSAVLLSACVSGTDGDYACANNSAESPLTGEIAGSVVVPRNATCFLKARVAGDVHAKDGARVYVLEGTRIGGSFRAVGASVVRFGLDNSTASIGAGRAASAGKIVVGSNLVIKESRLSGESGIASTDIGGNLVIARNATATGTPAQLNVCTPGLCKADMAVTVKKSVKIKQNHIAVAINNTSIGADLKCSSNDHAPVLLSSGAGGGQLAVKGRRSGQCEQLREIVVAPGGTPVAPAPTTNKATRKA